MTDAAAATLTLDLRGFHPQDLERVRRAVATGTRNADVRRAYAEARQGGQTKGDAIADVAERFCLSEDRINSILWPRR